MLPWLEWLLHPVRTVKRHNRRVRVSILKADASTRARDDAYERVMSNLHEVERQIGAMNGKGRR